MWNRGNTKQDLIQFLNKIDKLYNYSDIGEEMQKYDVEILFHNDCNIIRTGYICEIYIGEKFNPLEGYRIFDTMCVFVIDKNSDLSKIEQDIENAVRNGIKKQKGE